MKVKRNVLSIVIHNEMGRKLSWAISG